LKGAASLLFGPQTIGGVINYMTPTPPMLFGGSVQGTLGNRGYRNAELNIGGNGLRFDYTLKQGDGARDNMKHALDDLNLQYFMPIGSSQAVTLRANYHQEASTITYSGLTQAEFDQLGAHYNPFKNDKFNIDRTGLSATHAYDSGAGVLLLTSIYYSKFDRDWWRQASNSQDAQCGSAFNAARLAGTVVDADSCNSVQGRLRSYATWGIEPRLAVAHGKGEFQAGLKVHYEEQNRLQTNGTSPTARSGTLAEDTQRKTDAYALFVANRFDVGRLAITPILRFERVSARRRNNVNGVGGTTTISETMPGVGVTWNPNPTLTVFTSLHKGFAPPRVEDLIGGTGTLTEVDAEKSTNFELGVRSQPRAGIAVQATYFHNDFDNLIASGSIAGGSTPLSQGRALFAGLELGAQAMLKSGFSGRIALTWLPTAEQTNAFRSIPTQALVGVAGKRQPYAPKQTLTVAAGYEIGGWHAEIEAQHVGEQYSDFANTDAASANGQVGLIKSYTAWNTALNYRFDQSWSGFFSAKNLADSTYIVDRTRGIQVGTPRLVQIGAKYVF
jgi:Fe(3+) dicitrate transport protein